MMSVTMMRMKNRIENGLTLKMHPLVREEKYTMACGDLHLQSSSFRIVLNDLRIVEILVPLWFFPTLR